MLQKIKRYAALLLVLALVCCALPAAAMAADAAPTTVKLAAGETTLAFLNTGSGDGLYCYNGWGDGSKAMDQSQSVNGDGAFVPLYYYWVKGGQPVDVDPDMPPQYSPNAQFDLSKWLDFKTVDVYITNLDKTVKMWSVQLKPTATASATHNGKLTFVDADGGLTTVNFFMAEDHGTIGSIAVTDAFRLETVLQNSYRQEWSNLLSVYYDGIAPSTEYFYLYTQNADGGNNTLTQAGEIDLDSLQVTSSDSSLVRVVGTVDSTQDGRPAVGFQLQIIPPAQQVYQDGKLVEVTVSFKSATGSQYTCYSSYMFTDHYTGETVTVDNAADFEKAYNRMVTGTILLADGTYPVDLVFGKDNRQVTLRAVNTGKAVITGKPGSTAPILQYANGSNTWGLVGIVIDGDENPGEKRDGVGTVCEMMSPWGPMQVSAAVSGFTVRDCAVGIQAPGVSLPLNIGPLHLESNDVAIDANARMLAAHSCNFVNNGIGVQLYGTYSSAIIRNSRFISDTAKTGLYDIAMSQAYPELQFTQNYFGTGTWVDMHSSALTVRKPAIKRDGGTADEWPVYYAPYQVDHVTMAALSADLAGAQPAAAATFGTAATVQLPVDNTAAYGSFTAATLDAALFDELKASGDDVTVHIPVTENVETAATVTTEWVYTSDSLAEAPTGMDLRVTDRPSSDAVADFAQNQLPADSVAQHVNFRHEGALPGTATVKVLKTDATALTDLKLYHIEKDGQGNPTGLVLNTYAQVTLEDGYYILQVDHCSEYVVASGPDAATCQHTGGTATCTVQAVCSKCKAYYGDYVHNYEQTFDTAEHWQECTVCRDKKDAAEHSFDNACDTSCGGCTYTRVITHDYTGLKHSDAEHWYECSVCRAEKPDSREAHKDGTATCTDKPKCAVCGVEYGTANGHGETELKNARPAACDAEGYTGDKHCKVCGEKLESGTPIAKTEHSYKWVVDREPTTAQTGLQHEECTACQAKRNVDTVIPKIAADVPQVNIPNTGDDSFTGLWYAVFAASLLAAAALLCFRRQRG